MANRKRPVSPEEDAAKSARKANLEAVGQRLQERRNVLNMSQEVVTSRVKDHGLFIQRTTYAHYENGIVEMDITALIAVARALKTTVGYLLGEDETTFPPDTGGEWLNKLRSLSLRVPQGRSRSLFQQRVLDFTEAEAAFVKLVDPRQPHQEAA